MFKCKTIKIISLLVAGCLFELISPTVLLCNHYKKIPINEGIYIFRDFTNTYKPVFIIKNNNIIDPYEKFYSLGKHKFSKKYFEENEQSVDIDCDGKLINKNNFFINYKIQNELKIESKNIYNFNCDKFYKENIYLKFDFDKINIENVILGESENDKNFINLSKDDIHNIQNIVKDEFERKALLLSNVDKNTLIKCRAYISSAFFDKVLPYGDPFVIGLYNIDLFFKASGGETIDSFQFLFVYENKNKYYTIYLSSGIVPAFNFVGTIMLSDGGKGIVFEVKEPSGDESKYFLNRIIYFVYKNDELSLCFKSTAY